MVGLEDFEFHDEVDGVILVRFFEADLDDLHLMDAVNGNGGASTGGLVGVRVSKVFENVIHVGHGLTLVLGLGCWFAGCGARV
jgi:hypothetical protein